MGAFGIQQTYNTKEKCLAYLEELRWKGVPVCAHCGGTEHITKRLATNIYHCNECNKDFTVLVGTIFEHSHLPLPKWFYIVSLMLEAKKGIASTQLASNAEIPYKTAWFVSMRIRCAMVEDIELSGVIEGDEMYIGGKPRKQYKNDDSFTSLSQINPNPDYLKISNAKRGRGTSKAKIAGMVERKGNVVLRLMDTFSTATLLAMLKRNVDTSASVVVTDEARFYSKFDDYVQHLVIKHKETFVKGDIHVNTIEGFWSIVKAGIKGQYRVLSKRYLPFYLSEFAYRYNRRNEPKLIFEDFMKDAVSEPKCMAYNKPLVEPIKIVNQFTPEQKKLAAKNTRNRNKISAIHRKKKESEKADRKAKRKLLKTKTKNNIS